MDDLFGTHKVASIRKNVVPSHRILAHNQPSAKMKPFDRSRGRASTGLDSRTSRQDSGWRLSLPDVVIRHRNCACLVQVDGECVQAVDQDSWSPGQLLGRHREPQPGEAGDQGAQRDPAFQPGQWCAEAMVETVAEG